MQYVHPGYKKPYPITTVLRDLASQEGCDGEPYDVMIAAADVIDSLKKVGEEGFSAGFEAATLDREYDDALDIFLAQCQEKKG